MLKMISATTNDLAKIIKLYDDCKQVLKRQGIFQWDELYPNQEIYLEAISNNAQYLFLDDELFVGVVILSESQSEEWQTVAWKYCNQKTLAIHALAISPATQGKGYGQQVLELCEAYAVDKGYQVMRLDACSENPVALGLYEKNGYQQAGVVSYIIKPVGHQLYYCYEKLL